MLRRLILVSFAIAVTAAAAEPPPPDFAAAIAAAPGVSAARTRAAAMHMTRHAAGVLPDPRLRLEAGPMRTSEADSWTYGAGIEQPLPRWGERDADRARAIAGIPAAEAEVAVILGDTAAMVAGALAEADAAGRTADLQAASRERLQALVPVFAARSASGGSSRDSLRLSDRIEALGLAETDARRRAEDARSEARARLGLAEDAALTTVNYPTIGDDHEPSPAERQAVARVGEARADLDRARSRSHPETAVGLRWERDEAGELGRSDKFVLGFDLSLPVWRGAYDAEVESAQARERSARIEVAGETFATRARFTRTPFVRSTTFPNTRCV